MMFRAAALSYLLPLSSSFVSAQLLVDFSQASNPDIEAGYQAYTASHENIASFTTQDFTAFGTTISITPDWPDTSNNRVQQLIDRSANNDANWLGNNLSLLTDFIGVDSRSNNGGNGNYDGTTGSPTRMTLTLSGLPAATYAWRSYHHDTENVHTSFTIEFSNNGGTSYTAVDTIFPGTNSSPGGNPSAPQTYTGTPDPDPANLPSTADFNFTASAGQDVVIRFTPLSNTGVHRQIWAMNGFKLESSVLPAVDNDSATNIMATTATIGGSVTSGGPGNVTLYWGDNDAGTTAGNWDNAINLGSQSGSFNAALSSLTSATTYYYRSFISNAAGQAWAGSTASFNTGSAGSTPSLLTLGATNVSFTQADLNGNVTDTGGDPPQVTVFYGTTNGGTDPNAWDAMSAIGVQSGVFTDTPFNLLPDTPYFFRVRGTNAAGTSWAPNTQTFTTLAFSAPVVEVSPPSFVAGTTATLTGEVTDDGNDAPEITVFYGTSDEGSNAGSWQNSTSVGPQSSTFTAPVSGLAGSTTYFYRIRATNSVATVWSASAQSFTTGIPSDIIINEFMAANDTTLVPNAVANTFDDWIELLNTSSAPIDLGGWHLTDSPGQPNKWTFPAGTTVGVGEFLVIIANGSGIPDANGNPTVNFKLSAGGDYLALVRPNLSVASEFGPGGMIYPEQSDDVSYGKHPTSNADVYFSTPTPGAPNDIGGVARVEPLQITPKRGYYETAQTITISTPTAGAQIYYTTDGAPPLDATGTPAATAQLYSAPFQISTTTVLRAAASLTNFDPSATLTNTYLLLDISGANPNGTDSAGLNTPFLTQTQPAGYGGLSSGDFNMDPEISQSTAASAGHGGLTVAQAMLQGMRDVPTISIALPKDDFSGSNGIYFNSQSQGIAWERACSAEFIPSSTDTRPDFQENCGLRVQGGASRIPNRSPKHSLSFRFRTQYGEGRLRQALFPGSSVEEFNSIALRAGYNNSWIHSNSAQRGYASMIRDQWMRESMKDMGHPDAGEGFLAHVFINGLYWGLHNIAERQDNTHYAEYNGDNRDLIDARNGATFVNGTTTSWNQMRTTVAAGNWDDIQQVLDVDTYIDYHLLQRFGANQDLKTDGNWRAAGGGPFTNPTDMRPWKLFSWDGERVLELPTATNVPLDPMNIRPSLEALPEYRQRFSDRARMHLTGDGALTPAKCEARWMKYANNIDRAIIAESARWGDHRRATPYDRDDWLTEQNRLRNSYFPVRTTNVINKLKTDGLYSEVEPPAFTVDGSLTPEGYVAPGSVLSAVSGDGTVYYTTDGSDPSLPDGTPNPSASFFSSGIVTSTVLSFESAGWKYLNDPTQPQSASNVVDGQAGYSSADWKHPDFDDSSWSAGTALLAGSSATSISGYTANSVIDIGTTFSRYPTVYFRKSFNLTNASSVTELNFSLIRDDGAIVYLNGREIFRSNMNNGTVYSYGDFAPQAVPDESAVVPHTHTPAPGDLLEGENIISIEVHNNSATSSDLGVALQLTATSPTSGGNSAISLTESSIVTARLFDGSEWSAPVSGAFLTEQTATSGSLAITEINYHPAEVTVLEQSSTGLDLSNRDEFEFIELQNIGSADLNLYGTQFIAGIAVTFGLEKVSVGEHVVVARNPAALEVRYGSPLPFRVVGTYTSGLSNDGELLTLSEVDLTLIKSLTFNDAGSWPSRPDGEASTLEIIDPLSDPNNPDNWRSSIAYNGTPGAAPITTDQQIVINEVSSHDAGGNEFIELHNTTMDPIDITGWVISDSKSVYQSYRFPSTTIPAMDYITIPSSAYEDPVTNVISNYEGAAGFSPATVVSNGHGLATGDVVSISGYGGISDYNGTFEVTVTDANRFTIPVILLDNVAAKGTWVSGRTFGLSAASGDDLWLVETDANGLPTAFVDHVEFAAARENETLGRWPNGAGSDTLITMTTQTSGSENSGPLLGPIFIAEVHFRNSSSDSLEFVEICNSSSQTVSLENWRLRGGLDFDFTSAHSLPSQGVVVVVPFDPATQPALVSNFQTSHGIDGSVTLIGPALDGPLNDDEGTVRLQAPDTPTVANPTVFPQVTTDSVDYLGAAPWPATGDQSLNRNPTLGFGNFATSWSGDTATPGNKPGGLTYTEFAQNLDLGGPLDDDDGDGAANLIEFATGSNALDVNEVPMIFTSGTSLGFNLNLQAQGVTVVLQTATDLKDWTTVATQAGATNGALQERILNFDPSSESVRFWRLQILR
ncbi:MAG: lamin tail domain-containing protein [Akkermansiaceae bacterium]